jgi:hypothetical protein
MIISATWCLLFKIHDQKDFLEKKSQDSLKLEK